MASLRLTAAALGAAAVLLAAHPALAEPLQLDLTNGASRDLEEFYASPAGAGTEQDILGAAFLPAGNSATLMIAEDQTQCAYDLRFVFSSGDAVEEAAFNVCENGNYTLSD